MVLDETARANAIRGVAGMRSYIFWVDAVQSGAPIQKALYHKVLYKITTDPQELAILEQALASHGLTDQLKELDMTCHSHFNGENPEVMELNISKDGEFSAGTEQADKNALRLRKSEDSKGHSDKSSDENTNVSSNDHGMDGSPFYHELDQSDLNPLQKKEFRKQLNKKARQSVQGSCHEAIKLIVHRPEATAQNRQEYHNMATTLFPVIQELIRKTNPLLEHELSSEFAKSQLYGTKFCADRTATLDFRVFARKRPPEEEPSLAVALYEFCTGCGIPIMIYGDTADRSKLEQMSMYAYVDFESKDADEKYTLMNIQARSNNRDGMALRIIGDRLVSLPQKTKLIISISDGQPKAIPDYTGEKAASSQIGTNHRKVFISMLY